MNTKNSRGDRLSTYWTRSLGLNTSPEARREKEPGATSKAAKLSLPPSCIAEFTDKYTRENLDPRERLKFLKTISALAPLDEETAEMAGKISAERRSQVRGWGLVDSDSPGNGQS